MSLLSPSLRSWRRLSIWVAGMTGATLVLAGVGWGLLPLVPLPDGLEDPVAVRPEVDWVDRNGVTLRRVPASDADGFTAPLAEADIPESVLRTTLAAEDARFFRHPGVDVWATLRAAGQWIRNGRIVSGGSTVTQQLVKSGHPRPRTLRTKLIEAVQALRLEREWDKLRILRAYLARIDYGNRCVGLAAGARHYFGKSPAQLDWAEAAYLAGLPQAPTRLNPRLRPERAKRRQEWILRRCLALGWRAEEDVRRDVAEALRLRPAAGEFLAPHFVDHLQSIDPAASGRMETTLDLRIQQAAEEAVRRHLKGLESRQVRDAAVVVLDTRDASVLAWVGSPDWSRPDGGQVNGPLARRSPGSALKPFLYGLGFERGWTAASVVPDVPTEVVTPTGLFRPENYDRHFRGPVSLREALAGSLNVPAVRLLDQLGGPEILQERLTRLGLATLDRPAPDYGLGLVLGNAEVRLVDLTAAYATLGRLGVHRPWRVRPGALGLGIPVAPSGACWLVGDILRDPLARASQFGLATPLRMSAPVAVKTGTSSGFRDNWAFGFTPEYTVGVWVGNFDGSPMRDVSGVDGAGPILNDVVTVLDRLHGTTVPPEPPGLQRWRVEPLSGHRVPVGRPGREEVFLEGTAPPVELPGERDSRGRVVLGSDYARWWPTPDQRLQGRAVLGDAPDPSGFRILHPEKGAVYWWDADLPPESQEVALRSNAPCSWECGSLQVASRNGETWVRLIPGRHRLVAVASSGDRSEVWLQVHRR